MKRKNIKLGIFFTGGMFILIVALFIVGSRQNLFESTITLKTQFTDAIGLKEGSAVRFMGITIGSVEYVSIENDTSVSVSMKINKAQSPYIKKDAKAVINSDGLMGNKILTIIPGSASTETVSNGDNIASEKPISMETVMNSVLENSRNLESLTKNLIEITTKISSGKGLVGKLLYDKTSENKFDNMLSEASQMVNNLEATSSNFQVMSDKINNGEGALGKLINDNSVSEDLTRIMDSLSNASSNITKATQQVNDFAKKLNNGDGPVSKLVNDTTMAKDLEIMIQNARLRTTELEETIELVNNSWILNLFSGNKKKAEKDSTNQTQENVSKIHETSEEYFFTEVE